MKRVEPNRNVYIGHRYVPLLVGEWDKSIQYEGLSIVTYKGASYTSKKMTPAGIDIKNEEYWVLTGNYNAQIEYYRQEVERYRDEVVDMGEYVDGEVKDLRTYVNDETASTRQYVDDNVNDLTDYVNDTINSKVDGTVETLDLYVSNGGNDGNTGSINSPFKTLSRAVEEIPDVIRKDHIVTVNLNSGVWDEILRIENKTIQGQLIVKGTTDDRENHKVLRVYTDSLNGNVLIENITTTAKNGNGQSFRIRRTSYIDINNVKSEGDPDVEKGVTGVIGLLADYGTNARVRNSDFSGKRYGIRCNYLSRVFSTNNTGSDNTFGIGSRWGGIISTYGTQPRGNTNTTVSSGGEIIIDSGGYTGLPNEPHLVNAVRNGHDGRYYKKEYMVSTINNSNTSITSGKALRLRFKGNQHGVHYLKVKYGGQTNSAGNGQAIEKIYTFTLQSNDFYNIRNTHVHEHLMTSDRVDLVHTGSNETFDLIINPLAAVTGRWAAEIELSVFRHFTAPTLDSVEIIDY